MQSCTRKWVILGRIVGQIMSFQRHMASRLFTVPTMLFQNADHAFFDLSPLFFQFSVMSFFICCFCLSVESVSIIGIRLLSGQFDATLTVLSLSRFFVTFSSVAVTFIRFVTLAFYFCALGQSLVSAISSLRLTFTPKTLALGLFLNVDCIFLIFYFKVFLRPTCLLVALQNGAYCVTITSSISQLCLLSLL